MVEKCPGLKSAKTPMYVPAKPRTGIHKISKKFLPVVYISCQIQECWRSLLAVGTAVRRLERDAWSMVKWLRQATHEYAPPYYNRIARCSAVAQQTGVSTWHTITWHASWHYYGVPVKTVKMEHMGTHSRGGASIILQKRDAIRTDIPYYNVSPDKKNNSRYKKT